MSVFGLWGKHIKELEEQNKQWKKEKCGTCGWFVYHQCHTDPGECPLEEVKCRHNKEFVYPDDPACPACPAWVGRD